MMESHKQNQMVTVCIVTMTHYSKIVLDLLETKQPILGGILFN